MSAVLPDRWLHLIALTTERDVRLVRGQGIHVWDEDDNKYLDLDGAHGAALLGHGQPQVVAAMQEQLQRLTAVHHSVAQDARDELVEALSLMIPEPLSHVVPLSSAGAAIDAAVSAARATTRRRRIVNLREDRDRDAADVTGVAIGDLDRLDGVLDTDVAAVVLEPVLSTGGLRVPPSGFLAAVAQRCQRAGALLIIDEVQTALRTGAALACARESVVPDILCLGHSLANGLPIGVMATTRDVARRLHSGWHDDVESCGPLVCAAAAATLRIASNTTLQAHVGAVGEHLLQRLTALRLAEIREVRGRGLMVAVELRHAAASVVAQLQARGVLVIPDGNVIRMLPPLILERRQADAVVEALAASIRATRRERASSDDAPEVTLRGLPARTVKR